MRDDLVISLKTFLRDKHLFRCLDSIRRYYPDVRLAIADDGHQNGEKDKLYREMEDKGHYIFRLPFDVGMMAGRNHIIENTKEPYLLYIDDDYVFTADTDIGKFLNILKRRSDIDMIGGRVRVGGKLHDYQGNIIIKNSKLTQVPLEMNGWEEIDGVRFKKCDLTFNFYMIKRRVLDAVKFDDKLKIGCAHMDYFLSVKKAGFQAAFSPDVIIDHEHFCEQDDPIYENYRARVEDGLRYFAQKRGLKKARYFNGNTRDYRSLKEKEPFVRFYRLKIIRLLEKIGIKEYVKKFSGKIFRHKNYKKFLIVSRSRSGSNYLLSLLNSHSAVNARGELISNVKGRSIKSIIKQVYGFQPYYINAAGFVIFYYHPNDGDTGELWRELLYISDLKIIHLKRRNLLKTALSRKIAQMTGKWDSFKKNELPFTKRRVSFATKELSEQFKQTKDWQDDFARAFKENDMIELYYEDLAAAPDDTLDNIYRFLKLEPVKSSTDLKKQNPESAMALIKNYEELKKEFAGTEWEVFFDE